MTTTNHTHDRRDTALAILTAVVGAAATAFAIAAGALLLSL
jgi:hypothetical protein